MRVGLRSRIAMVVLLSTVLAVAGATLVSSWFVEEYSRTDMVERAQILASNLRNQLQRILHLHIPIRDIVGFEVQCQELLDQHPEFHHAFVVEPDGAVLFSADTADHSSLADDQDILALLKAHREIGSFVAETDADNVIVTVPAWDEHREQVALVGVAFTSSLIDQRVAGLMWRSLSVAFAFLLLGVAIAFTATTTWVTRPLRSLVHTMAAVRTAGAASASPVSVRSSDEIGVLGLAFNLMVSEVQEQQQQLEKQAAELQTAVADRTQELNATAKNLAASETRFRSIVEASPMGMHTYSLEPGDRLVFTGANPAADTILGVENAAFVGKTLEEAFPHLVGTEIPQVYRDVARQGKTWSTHQIHYEDDRIQGAFEVYVFQTSPGSVAVMFLDVTERLRAEEKIRESEYRYSELFNNISDFIFTHDMDGKLLTVNKVAAETLGYTAEELVGRHIQEFIAEGHRAGFDREYMEGLREHGGFEGVFKFITKDATERYFGYRSRLVEQEREGPFVAGMGRDITEKLLAERELRSMEEQLAQSQKMEAVGTLASGIAHDFNNVLQAILGYSQLVTHDLEVGSPNRERMEKIDTAAERARELVQGLLAFSRKEKAEFKPVNLNREVVQATDLLVRTLPKMVAVTTDLADDLRPIEADGAQLSQILLNLGINARDAMPQGGTLKIATANVQLSEDDCAARLGLAPGDHVVLEVSDTGTGIEADNLARIFEPFFTTKGVGQGTGLGLSAVYGIAKNHGGFIECDSKRGEGTTFRIFFPAMEEATRIEASPERDPGQGPSGHGTILLVDDEDLLREMGQGFLESRGYQVLTAASGEEALLCYQEHLGGDERIRIDLVVLDLGMPGMGGRQCLKQLLALDPAAKVLVTTGYGLTGRAQGILDEGIAGFLNKPYRLAELARRTKSILNDVK